MHEAPGSMPAPQNEKEERRDEQENGEKEMTRGKEFKGGEEGDGEKKEEQTQRQLPSPPLRSPVTSRKGMFIYAKIGD